MEGLADTYDVVVIGSGMGGLTCAGYAAKAGRKTLILEKHTKLGGYVQYFGRHFTFDSVLHFIPGGSESGTVTNILNDLGIQNKLEWVTLDPVYRAVFPEHDLLIPADREAYADLLVEHFPDDACNLRKLFNDLDAMGSAFLDLQGSIFDVSENRLLHVYRDKTAKELLSDYVQDEKLRAILSALWPLWGLPPSQLSALYFAMMWHLHHGQGVGYVKGGAKAFGLALASVVEETGGQVVTRARVTKILLEDGKAVGVQLEDGSQVRADAVVSNADPFQTYNELLPQEEMPSAVRERLNVWQPSVSWMAVHLGVEMPIDAPAHSAMVHDTYDFDAAFADAFADAPNFPSFIATVATKSDPERGQAGQNMVLLSAPASYERDNRWRSGVETGRDVRYRHNQGYLEFKGALGDRLAQKAERLFPGLKERAFITRVGTPLTMERYTFNHRGALHGWAHTPQQTAHRDGGNTLYANLFHVGQWVSPGAGIAPAMLSGKRAAEMILRDA
jgi:prolycopene isomerase